MLRGQSRGDRFVGFEVEVIGFAQRGREGRQGGGLVAIEEAIIVVVGVGAGVLGRSRQGIDGRDNMVAVGVGVAVCLVVCAFRVLLLVVVVIVMMTSGVVVLIVAVVGVDNGGGIGVVRCWSGG